MVRLFGLVDYRGDGLMPPASSFTQEKADIICDRIAKGESLRSICLDDDMPSHTTILKWLRNIDVFASQYARAREDQAEFYLDEIIAISDESAQDKIANEDGTERTDNEAIQRSKLKVDTRKWVMSKLAPKKYGDKITQELTGEIVTRGLSDDELDKRIAELGAKTGVIISTTREAETDSD